MPVRKNLHAKEGLCAHLARLRLWLLETQSSGLRASLAVLVTTFCCDYRTTATKSGGQIKCTGAIDVPEINREIAEVMEGGVEAVKLRYQKYGF